MTDLNEEFERVAPYSYCPQCGAVGVYRERRPNGNDRCRNGHTYLSAQAVQSPVKPVPSGADSTIGSIIREARQRCGCGSAERELAKMVKELRETLQGTAQSPEGMVMQRVPAVISPRNNLVGIGAHGFREAMQQARTEGMGADVAMTKLDALMWEHQRMNPGLSMVGLQADGYVLLTVNVQWRVLV